ncbi:TPA_asm: G [Populus betacytorhabdovirus 1]|nr:TPA_asm: G [Populus betacytorhabdovirus 1]
MSSIRMCSISPIARMVRVLIFFIFVTSAAASNYSRNLGADQELSITPLASCDGDILPLNLITQACLSQCPKLDQPYIVENWKIYDKIQPAHDAMIFHCSFYEEVWSYDESWLLSRTAGVMQSKKKISTTPSECHDLMREHCHGAPCNILPAEVQTPEYHYASTTIKTYKYGVGSVLKAVHYEIDGSAIYLHGIPGLSSQTNYSKGEASSSDGTDVFLWNVKPGPSSCHLTTWITTQCLRSQNRLLCDNIGLYAELGDPIPLPNCASADASLKKREIYMDKTGVWIEKADSGSSVSDRQYLTLPTGSATEAEKSIVTGFNEIIRVNTERECVQSCLSLHTHDKTQPKLEIVGYNFVLYAGSESYQLCRPLYECKVVVTEGMCSSPVSLRIKCRSEEFWWDPSKSFVTPLGHCHRGERSIADVLVVTSIGAVKVNSSGVYLIKSKIGDEIIHPIPQTNHLDAHYVSDFVRLWQSKESVSEVSKSQSTEIKRATWWWTEIGGIVGAIKDWLSSLSWGIRVIVSVVVGAIVLYICVNIFGFLKKIFPSNQATPNNAEVAYNRVPLWALPSIKKKKPDQSTSLEPDDIVYI